MGLNYFFPFQARQTLEATYCLYMDSAIIVDGTMDLPMQLIASDSACSVSTTVAMEEAKLSLIHI